MWIWILVAVGALIGVASLLITRTPATEEAQAAEEARRKRLSRASYNKGWSLLGWIVFLAGGALAAWGILAVTLDSSRDEPNWPLAIFGVALAGLGAYLREHHGRL